MVTKTVTTRHCGPACPHTVILLTRQSCAANTQKGNFQELDPAGLHRNDFRNVIKIQMGTSLSEKYIFYGKDRTVTRGVFST